MVMKILFIIVSVFTIVVGVRYTFYTKAMYEAHTKEDKKDFIKWNKKYKTKGYFYHVSRVTGVIFILIGLVAIILLLFNPNGGIFSRK
jgi:uncharacterized membrane protein YkgB